MVSASLCFFLRVAVHRYGNNQQLSMNNKFELVIFTPNTNWCKIEAFSLRFPPFTVNSIVPSKTIKISIILLTLTLKGRSRLHSKSPPRKHPSRRKLFSAVRLQHTQSSWLEVSSISFFISAIAETFEQWEPIPTPDDYINNPIEYHSSLLMVENFLSWTPRNRDLLSLPMLDTLLSFLSRSLSVTRQAVFCSLLTLLLPILLHHALSRNQSYAIRVCGPRPKHIRLPTSNETSSCTRLPRDGPIVPSKSVNDSWQRETKTATSPYRNESHSIRRSIISFQGESIKS